MSLPRVPDPYAWRLRGEDIRLVRPYLEAHERRGQRRPVCFCLAGLACAAHSMAVTS